MSVPPELLQMLQGGGGPPQPGPMGPPPGMDPGMGAPPEEDPAAGGPEDEPIRLLKQAFELLHRYQAVEPDEEDTATAAKLAAGIQAMLAKDQQDITAALGNPANHRLIRKAAAGNASAAGY